MGYLHFEKKTLEKAVNKIWKSSWNRPEKFTSHGLRAGSACAMLLAGYDPETVKVFGRWNSDACRRYVRIQVTSVTGKQSKPLMELELVLQSNGEEWKKL